MAGRMTGLRVLTALTCFASGILFLLFWGINITFWTLIGFILVIAAFAAGFLIARRDYIEGATPAGVAAVFTLFLLIGSTAQKLEGFILIAVVLLFASSGLGFFLYEVD
jgi:hypothetical protein